MITTDAINEAYINKIINRDLGKIQELQTDVVNNVLNRVSGALQDSFSSTRYSVENTSSEFSVLSYLRFIDMKYSKSMLSVRKKLPLYNRAIWPILYQETLPDLRYGLTKDIRREIRGQLIAATSQTTIQFPD